MKAREREPKRESKRESNRESQSESQIERVKERVNQRVKERVRQRLYVSIQKKLFRSSLAENDRREVSEGSALRVPGFRCQTGY